MLFRWKLNMCYTLTCFNIIFLQWQLILTHTFFFGINFKPSINKSVFLFIIKNFL